MGIFFVGLVSLNDRGDLFQIAAPAIKAMPLNRRSICNHVASRAT